MFIKNNFNYPCADFFYFDSLKNYVTVNLTPFQQKIAAFAILIFSSTALVYTYYYCFKVQKIEEEDSNDMILDFDNFKTKQANLKSQYVPNRHSELTQTLLDDSQFIRKSPIKRQVKPVDVVPISISQFDYFEYKHALADIKVVCQCDKKGELGQLEELQGRLQKRAKEVGVKVFSRKDWQTAIAAKDDLQLRKRIKIINDMHAKLYNGQSEPMAGEYVLAADEYNSYLKIMQTWNHIWKAEIAEGAFLIYSPLNVKIIDLQSMEIANPLSEDEKALKSYFELFKKYPQFQRIGNDNDHKKGIYEIIYEEEEIRAIQSQIYQNIYHNYGSHEFAAQASRPRLVFEDKYYLILRDYVITPKGVKLAYDRIIEKSQLNQCVGAAIMPIITLPNGETKISLILHYRHATQSWEFELPRGGSEPGETPEQTARRELLEETGYEVEKLHHLATFPLNSGALSSLVPVFSGQVTFDTEAEIDETEAIKGKFFFSYDEIMQALRSSDSCLEVIIDGKKQRYPVRDPFLYCALLLSDL